MEGRIRQAIRERVRQSSRKPFHWGGLRGFQQLEAIGQALQEVTGEGETAYLHRLRRRVEGALERNRPVAQDLAEAHRWLRRLAEGLHAPLEARATLQTPTRSDEVRREIEAVYAQFQPDGERQPAQAALKQAWHRLWQSWGPELLYCYDLPPVPPDNLQLEAVFGKLRRHQRRIRGCKSTKPLREGGHYQVLWEATSEGELLDQLRATPLEVYRTHRQRLAQADAERVQRYRLHRHPEATVRDWLAQHAARRAALVYADTLSPPNTS